MIGIKTINMRMMRKILQKLGEGQEIFLFKNDVMTSYMQIKIESIDLKTNRITFKCLSDGFQKKVTKTTEVPVFGYDEVHYKHEEVMVDAKGTEESCYNLHWIYPDITTYIIFRDDDSELEDASKEVRRVLVPEDYKRDISSLLTKDDIECDIVELETWNYWERQ